MGATMIHHQAVVDMATVQIGKGTRIYQFASVTRGTRLGADCVVWPFANLDGLHAGDRCHFASGVAIAAGFKFGNDVFVGPNVTLCNDMWPEVNPEGFDDSAFRKDGRYTIIVENGVSIGAGAVILPGVILHTSCMVAAGAVVDQSVPENVVFMRDGSMRGIPPHARTLRTHLIVQS